MKKIIKKKQQTEIINLTIKKNEQLCIYGMNGSGKTMLIKKLIKNKDTNTYRYIQKKELKEIIKYAYQLGIEQQINKKNELLSSGQKKKLILIKLIIKKKNVWLLDEPENFIDQLTIEWTKKKMIEHLNTNGIIIITKNKWANKQIQKIGLSGFEPLTFRLSSEHSTTKL